MSIRASVHSENLLNTISQEPVKGISPYFNLLDFELKGQSRHLPENLDECNIFVTIGPNFTKIRPHVYLGLETYWLGFWVKRSEFKVTAGRGMTVDDSLLKKMSKVETRLASAVWYEGETHVFLWFNFHLLLICSDTRSNFFNSLLHDCLHESLQGKQ